MSLFVYSVFAYSVIGLWVGKVVFYALLHSYRRRAAAAEWPPKLPKKDPFGISLFLDYKKAFETRTWLDMTSGHFDICGQTFWAKYLGGVIVRTIDPEVSKCFHATHFEDFGVRPLRFASSPYFFGPAITSLDGPYAQQRRAWLRPSFERAHIANFERLGRQIDTFMSLLPSDDSTVDLAPLFGRYNLDTSSEFIFGKSLNALTHPEGDAERFRKAYSYAVRGIALKQMLGNWLMYLHRDKAFDEARDVVWSHVDECVSEALKRREEILEQEKKEQKEVKTGYFSLVDELATETQDPLDLRFQIISVFNPAHKLTAVVLTNVFFLLARHPDMYEKLRKEILPTADEPLTYDLLKSYKLVRWTIKETHRLFTVSSFNQRQALHDVTLPVGGGESGKLPLYLPKGTVLDIQYHAMHRRKDIWGPDADEFVPERWEHMRPGWAYTPFGGGPRYCVGQDLAFTETAYMLVVMLRTFKRIENRDPEEKWVEDMNMTFESKNGAKVALFRD